MTEDETTRSPSGEAMPAAARKRIGEVGVEFDMMRILEALGGSPATIAAHLSVYCPGVKPPHRDAVYQWTARGRIASAWLPALLFAALRSGNLKPGAMFRHNAK